MNPKGYIAPSGRRYKSYNSYKKAMKGMHINKHSKNKNSFRNKPVNNNDRFQNNEKQITKTNTKDEHRTIRYIRNKKSTNVAKKLNVGIRYNRSLSDDPNMPPLANRARFYFGEKAIDKDPVLGSNFVKSEYIKKTNVKLVEDAKKPNSDVQMVIKGEPTISRNLDFTKFRKRPAGEPGIRFEKTQGLPDA